MVVVETKSGPIELVKEGPVMFLQFNCNCDDALPYCQAMCCRMRMAYNVELHPEEVEKFKGNQQIVNNRELYVLPIKDATTWDCSYLSDCRCTVHEDKPKRCRGWHCSPRGNINDETITKRDKGFAIMPSAIRSE